jgi:DNA (cytosine-5)-methyltransferase 1
MRILNLYSGIGGNRKLWGDDHKVTAIEYNEQIAKVYQDFFPHDNVIVTDAHQYLLEHYKEFDFIWSSPPCQSHSQYRHNVGVLGKGFKPVLPDMTLYSQIVFLKTYYKGFFVVENVKPYYKPLVEPNICLQRHLFWSNFEIKEKTFKKSNIRTKNKISDFEGYEKVAFSNIKNKRQVLRNCVLPELGKYIFDQALIKE